MSSDGQSLRIGLPTINAYGMLIGTNLPEEDINSDPNSCQSDECTSNLFGYYIMPKYMMTLEEYLE